MLKQELRINSSLVVNSRDSKNEVDATAVIDKPPKSLRFTVFPGNPTPFGATAIDGGVNFAIFSGNSISATLCFFTLSDLHKERVTEEIILDPLTNKTGDIWHVYVKGDFDNMLYGYKFDGPFLPEEGHYYNPSSILLDPFAKAVISRDNYGELGPEGSCWPQMACMIPSIKDEFDWQGDLPLKFRQRDLIIYEMHVRGFTRHESSSTKYLGTYLGVTEKLDHLKELGINCIELMPCHEFNELEYYSYNSAMGDHKVNFWGYSTVSFFSPMIRYSASGSQNCGRDAINEFKLLVREAHKRGIEVRRHATILSTYFGNVKYSTYSFCTDRYWVTEMHIDGFRFDLASILTRGSSLWDAANVYGTTIEDDMLTTGTPLSSPPLLDMISNDPILCRTKLIAEAWDCGGLYQVGDFPHWGIWSEWNGKYRDMVRLFIKGTDGFAGAFAECLCGSPNLYQKGGRRPWHSINFVCAHDGFTLADLVTYNEKHNLANGENNNDGENHNNSWNCGQEGEFASISVKQLRKRQMRNFFLCLMVSQGVPMIYMGDEYGHTKGGNNNSYCHDNYLNYFRWDKKDEAASDFYRFCRLMTKFRSECESLGLSDFPTSERLQWHGHVPECPDWSEASRFVAFSMKDLVKEELYIAFNTSHLPITVNLPSRPGYTWEPLVDTGKTPPYDFLFDDVPERRIAAKQYQHFLDSDMYPILSYSSIILLLKPDIHSL
ncbi:hypothetical protein KSS87_006934 [Heliosperma pusillum]|nr:hypothetical protein KSS87_006934 [Heliosperma pusillum]